MKTLVVGGTGPTGVFLIKGLVERGCQVTIFHRGTHELDEIPRDVEHIHGDPHFLESIVNAVRGRSYDLVVASYGRIRLLVQAMKGKTERFIAISGMPVYRGYFDPHHNTPFGLPVPTPEDAAVIDDPNLQRFSYLIAETEKTVMAAHLRGDFDITCFRYPQLYGPYQVNPFEWLIIRRILHRRPHIILPDGGLSLETRGYTENVAHGVLLAVEHPKVSRGQIYNLGDERQLTIRQWVETISSIMGYSWEIVSMPEILAKPARTLLPFQGPTSHRLMSTRKIQDQLGYRDKVPMEKAFQRTVEWLLKHRPLPGGRRNVGCRTPLSMRRRTSL